MPANMALRRPVARPGWRWEPPPAHTEGPASRTAAPESAAAARESEAAVITAGPGRAGPALREREWGRPRRRTGSGRNGGESFIFRLEKWREPRPFFKLGLGRGGGCATSAARARPSPAPRAPGRARLSPGTRGGFPPPPLLLPSAAKAPSSPPGPGPCPPGRRQPQGLAGRATSTPALQPLPQPARGARSPAWPAAGPAWDGRAAAGLAGSRRAAHPGRLQTWLPALHNPSSLPRHRPHAHALLREGPRRTRSSKFAFPPPHHPPLTAAGARGRQRVNPRALAPPSAPARPPFPSEPASCALPRAEAGEPAAGAPQVATITCKSLEERAPEGGLCLQLPGSGSSAPGGSSSSCPCSPRPPSSNLTFRGGGGGGRGVPACAARAVGRGLLSAEAGGAVRCWAACGVRAGEWSPRSQVTHGSGEKPWREKGAGAQRWSHYRRPRPRTALRLNRRRGAGGCSAHSAPRGAAGLGGRGCTKDGAGRRSGAGAGERRHPGDPSDFLPPVARGVADVRPSSGGFPAHRPTETPPPPGPPRCAQTRVSDPHLDVCPEGSWGEEALESGFGGP